MSYKTWLNAYIILLNVVSARIDGEVNELVDL